MLITLWICSESENRDQRGPSWKTRLKTRESPIAKINGQIDVVESTKSGRSKTRIEKGTDNAKHLAKSAVSQATMPYRILEVQ